MNLTFVTPERKILVNQDVDEITIPAFRGELNILPGHAPLVTTLNTGIMKWVIKGEATAKKAVVSWGYCEVSPVGITILADMADLPEDIDKEEAQSYLKDAYVKSNSEQLDEKARESLEREISRVQAQLELV